ncbi:hydroxyethylthiazole kinase [Halorientalis halophila]|uniref:hydroxyethylthiazole kinase n=1 Tax=Halorientalis halophila TaxID=3108499 RepID=UPI003009E0D6
MSVDLQAAFDAVAETGPLVNCITNDVTVNDVANVVLHWGGLPVMSDDPGDAPEMVAGAQGLLLNMGTVSEAGLETFLATGESAMEHDVPIVVDPVGVGATSVRDEAAERLVTDLDPTVIKGNYGEITALAGETADVRGVESVGEYDDIVPTAQAVAEGTGAVVIASGVTDVVATADRAFEVDVGDARMGEFVGSGCMLGATAAVFAGSVADPLDASLAATVAFGRAGERAAAGAYGEFEGPASYRIAFLDATAGLDAAEAASDADRITELG